MAVNKVAFPLLGLPVGVWIDRLPRRPVMIAADLGRALVLASLPAAAFSGHLSLPLLYAVAALMDADAGRRIEHDLTEFKQALESGRLAA